jgi:hypothetical protein
MDLLDGLPIDGSADCIFQRLIFQQSPVPSRAGDDWLALNFVFVVILVMMYLMAFRKLPSYIIEEEEKK